MTLFERLYAQDDLIRDLLLALDRELGSESGDVRPLFARLRDVVGHHLAAEEKLLLRLSRHPEVGRIATEAQAERVAVRRLLGELAGLDGTDARWPQAFDALKDELRELLANEEDSLFKKLRKLVPEKELGRLLAELEGDLAA